MVRNWTSPKMPGNSSVRLCDILRKVGMLLYHLFLPSWMARKRQYSACCIGFFHLVMCSLVSEICSPSFPNRSMLFKSGLGYWKPLLLDEPI